MSDDGRMTGFEETYSALRADYVERLRDNEAHIRSAAEKTLNSPVDREDLAKMQSLSHGLAGSGATFGFPEVTNAGRRTELLAEKLSKSLKDDELLLGDPLTEYQSALNELADACEKAQTLAALPDSDLVLTEKPAPATLDGKKRINILVVDDDRSLTALVSLKLTQRNFGVMTAHNGTEALMAARERQPDLIILDINMPGPSGHDVLRSLKQDSELAKIPVLMLTASAKQHDVVGALHSGAMDYIVKPIDINDLVTRVEKLRRTLSRTILVADNDQLILSLLHHKFMRHGLNVILADNGVAALAEAQKNIPDLILLDLRMPGMDGFGVLEGLKARDDTRNIPVIILSASKDEDDIRAAKNAGATDYVSKPFVADKLLSRCMKALNKE
ncbi:MAG: response regulator [Micavibrio sp.]|nr:response regulator [Micavibrio sp.]